MVISASMKKPGPPHGRPGFFKDLLRLMDYPKANFSEKQALLTVVVIVLSSKTFAFSKPHHMASDCGRKGSNVFPWPPLYY
jgi:hypothetical protein